MASVGLETLEGEVVPQLDGAVKSGGENVLSVRGKLGKGSMKRWRL